MVKLKSETMTHVLKVLLWALVAMGGLDVASMLVYASDYEAFLDHVYPFYGFTEVFSYYLYLVVVVVYLIWIYRVHMDLQTRIPRFPRSPGMALVCMMVPLYNLYGIPSIYQTIGNQYLRYPRLQEDGRLIRMLAIPLLLFILVCNVMNRYIARTDVLSDGLLVISSILQFMLYFIFLQLCLKVSRGLSHTVVAADESLEAESAQTETPAM